MSQTRGCAWPDPDDHRSRFEFCENGAKAFVTEATRKRVTPDVFKTYSVQEFGMMSDMALDKLGRITNPMILREGSNHYEPIEWSAAFEIIADKIASLNNPDEAVFYTSGRASNEAAFLWGLLARQIGTNNLPDCSNMCHESSGYALSRSIGIGKGTVRLSCFEEADLILVIGQNPGTNHPRMLTALAECKKKGGSVISINPLEETGLRRFKHPQKVIQLLGKGTPIADDHFPVRIGGDAALLQGIAKIVLEDGNLDLDFINEHTIGFEDWKTHIESVDWDEIITQTGLNKSQIEKLIQQSQIDEKKRIKNEKELAKQAIIDEKIRIKEEKILAKKIKLEEKRRIKEEKILAKKIQLEEKRRIKEEKALAKSIELEKKREVKINKKLVKNKIVKEEKINEEKTLELDAGIGKVKIDLNKFSDLVEKITKKNSLRPFPDINDIPN